MSTPQELAASEDGREVFNDGNMTDVVRQGNTVVRQCGAWSHANHAVLKHLETVGFPGAPRLLSVEGAEETLTFVPGTSVPADLAGFAGDDVLVAVASLIRKLHDALSSFDPEPHLDFPRMPGAPVGSRFVCHNDLAPWNTIFEQGRARAFIDWDLVAPAPPAWDIAYAAWRFVPLYPDDARYGHPLTRGWRLRLFLDTYALDMSERRDFVRLIRARQLCAYETVEQWGKAGRTGFDRLLEQRLHVGALDDIAWLDVNATVLHDAIMS
jgi:hypothetical protein